MQVFSLDSMTKGWWVGDFSSCVVGTKDFEVAVKYDKKGECESRHYHKIATEITCIAQGKVKMNGEILSAGEIVVISPKESTDFIALENTITAVVKMPSVKNDKFLGEFVETNFIENADSATKGVDSSTKSKDAKC